MRWREAMQGALYGPGGFFTGTGDGPAGHFRTSAHTSPLFAGALARLTVRIDEALGHPEPLDVVDVGAGRGELLCALISSLPDPIAGRVRATAVELAPRPPSLPAGIAWVPAPPEQVTGLLLATEWLDNVPMDVVGVDDAGTHGYVMVDDAGHERRGPAVAHADAVWLERWWPLTNAPAGARAEVGAARDAAWAAAVGTVRRGLALAVDYGHLRGGRPAFGTLSGYRAGRRVPPVPDGTCDLTAHVALDSVAAAGAAVAGVPASLLSQRAALRALGVDGTRPPLELAHRDPVRYVQELAAASVAAELTDPEGLGGHYWLLQPIGITVDLPEVAPLGMTESHTVG